MSKVGLHFKRKYQNVTESVRGEPALHKILYGSSAKLIHADERQRVKTKKITEVHM